MRNAVAAPMRGALWLALLCSGDPAAAQTVPWEIGHPANIPRVQPVAPGGSGVFAISVRSRSGPIGNVTVAALSRSPLGTPAGYTFVPRDPSRCAVPVITRPFWDERLNFVVGPIGSDETLVCEYTVTRLATMIHDLGLDVCQPYIVGAPFDWEICAQRHLYGSLPDLSLSAALAGPFLPGATEALVTLRLTNHSDFDVASRVATTECGEFGGGNAVFPSIGFDLETGFPGSCPAANGQDCVNFTGQNNTSHGFELAPVAAHGTNSCLVRIKFAAAAPPFSARLYLLDESVRLTGGGIAFDPDGDDDGATIRVLGSGDPNPIPLSRASMAVLMLTLVLAGVAALTWRRRTATRH